MATDSGKKTLIIVLAVIGVLVLCCCGAVLGLVAVGIIAEPETVIEDVGRGIVGEPEPQPGGDDEINSRDFGAEVQRAIDWFYPGHILESYAILAGGDDELASIHIIAMSPESPEFRILFEATREGGDFEVIAGPTHYHDTESPALWTHDTGAVGLQGWAGPDSIAPKVEIPARFVEAHPEGDLLVTDYEMISNVQVRLLGIREIELDGWDGVSTSWESVWDLDIANSKWDEISFE